MQTDNNYPTVRIDCKFDINANSIASSAIQTISFLIKPHLVIITVKATRIRFHALLDGNMLATIADSFKERYELPFLVEPKLLIHKARFIAIKDVAPIANKGAHFFDIV